MNTDILLTDALLLSAPGHVDPLPRSYVRIRDGRIAAVGAMDELKTQEAGLVISAAGTLLMPGLVNTHCHAAMTLFRGLADDLDLAAWLGEHIFPAEAAHASPEMVYWCSKLAAAEMLLSGTTLVADGYFHEGEAARAFSDAGIRAVAAQGVIDFPAPGVPDPAENLQAAARFIDRWQGRDPLIMPAVFAHSPYTCSPATIRGAKELARSRQAPFFIHVAESAGEQGLIADKKGSSPIRHLDALGVLDSGTVCVHCVWLDEEDLDILARSGAGVTICPQSHLKLASGIAPLDGMLARSIPVGLGTDGAASNNGLDLFREMDLCAKVQKVLRHDQAGPGARQVLQMAAGGGARILGLAGRCGVVRQGAMADLIMIDLAAPHLQPFHSQDTLVYSPAGGDVRTVIVNGKVVVRDRKLLSFDLEETMARVRELAARLAP